jgi:hypothetical protein
MPIKGILNPVLIIKITKADENEFSLNILKYKTTIVAINSNHFCKKSNNEN